MSWNSGRVYVEWLDGDKRTYAVSGKSRSECVRVADGVLHLVAWSNEYEPGKPVAAIPVAAVREWTTVWR